MPAQAALGQDGSKPERKSHHHGSAEKPTEDKGTGLDSDVLSLANHGDWEGFAAKLEVKAAVQPVSRDAAWLAFTYMYLGKCNNLYDLSDKARSVFDARSAAGLSAPPAKAPAPAATQSTDKAVSQTAAPQTTSTAAKEKRVAADESQIYAALIQAYSEICHGRLKDADAEMTLVPDWFRYDALCNYTFAAIAGKQGRSADAVEYMQRTVGAAPEFAWGLRTLGKLQQNKLKDPVKAEATYLAAIKVVPDLADVVDALVDLRTARNDYDGAIDIANDSIKASPKNSAGYYRLSQIYTKQYRLREALAQLQTAIDIDPDVARYYRSRASVKRSQGELNDAVADQQKAVDLSKDKPFELVELANMNQAAGNVNRAADDLQQALKLDPNDMEAHNHLVALLTHEKRSDDLITEYNRYLALKPKDVSAKIGLAQALLAAGKTKEATEQFIAASNLDPNNPEPHRELGALRIKVKDYGGAAREYTKSLNINPSSVTDLVALGYCYAQNDDYAQAEAALITALALQQLTQPNTLRTSPERLDLMRSLAVLLMDEGRYSEAAAQFDGIYVSSKGTDPVAATMDLVRLTQAKALRDLSTASAKSLVELFNTLPAEQQKDQRPLVITSLLEARKPDLALPLLDQEEKAQTGKIPSSLKIERAQALLLKGDAKGAQTLIANLTPDATDEARPISEQLATLSKIAVANSNLSGADDLARKAVEKYPKNYDAYVQLGRVRLKEGKTKEAIDFAKKALEINQYSTLAYLLLGDAQSTTGSMKDASANYRKAAELYPGLLEAHRALLESLRKLSMKDEAQREAEQIAQMEKQQ